MAPVTHALPVVLLCEEQKAKNFPMWFGSTRSLLESIVRWLQSADPRDESAWQAQTELAQACLAEMMVLSEPISHAKGSTSRYVHRPVAEKLNRAMPHVQAMLTAMRERDRFSAVAHGETAFRRL
jgi:hypothetical protein